MTSASGTPTLLHNDAFDGITDIINWSVSILSRSRANERRMRLPARRQAQTSGGKKLIENGRVDYIE